MKDTRTPKGKIKEKWIYIQITPTDTQTAGSKTEVIVTPAF